MAYITPASPTNDGGVLAPVAATAAGDRMDPGADTFLYVKNAGAATISVTIDSVAQCSYGFDHNIVVTLGAATERMIGPFPASRFASPTDGLVAITYSAVASVTVAAVIGGSR